MLLAQLRIMCFTVTMVCFEYLLRYTACFGMLTPYIDNQTMTLTGHLHSQQISNSLRFPVLQIATLHRWQDTLWVYTHGSMTPMPHPSCHVFQEEAITHAWMQLTKALHRLLNTHPQLLRSPEVVHCLQVAQQMDRQLGLSEGPPPKPLLWRYAGHPSMPSSLKLCHLQMQLHQLCAVTRSGMLCD